MRGHYPYEYARISAMKSLLLRREEYDRLAKVEPVEMAKLLEERGYREVSELASAHRGAQLVEAAAELHLSRVLEKVRRICTGKVKTLAGAYLAKLDIERTKRALRAAHSRKEPVVDLLKRQRMIPLTALRSAIAAYEKTGALTGIENALDTHYYSMLAALPAALREQNIQRLFDAVAEAAAVRLILKAKQEGVQVPELAFMPRSLGAIAKLPPEEAISAIAARYRLPRESLSGMSLEMALGKQQLAIARAMWKPLAAGAVVSFIVLQELEVLNLRLLLKAKEGKNRRLGQMLVVAS